MLLPTDLVLSADGRQLGENEGGLTLAMRCVLCAVCCECTTQLCAAISMRCVLCAV